MADPTDYIANGLQAFNPLMAAINPVGAIVDAVSKSGVLGGGAPQPQGAPGSYTPKPVGETQSQGAIPPPPTGFTVDGPSAPQPYGAQSYFKAVKAIYPNAVFTGGARTPEHNAAVGGVPDSMHLNDQALDFQVPGVSSDQVFQHLQSAGLPMSEELNEGNHLHVGWGPKGGQPAPSAGIVPPPPPGFTVDNGTSGAIPPPPSGFTVDGSPASTLPKPNFMERGIMSLANSPFIKGVSGSYMEGVTSGMFMQPVRAAMEATGYGMDKLKAEYPNQSAKWYNDTLHAMYSDAVNMSRQQAQQQTSQNPYPGHQVGNTLASLASQPEMLLAPGGAQGASVVGRMAKAGLTNAGIAGVSDAAAQGMDMLEGQKKDFDVKQNLTQAVIGGVVGVGLHGATEATPVISDFVKGLFKDRGIDTTPSANPTGMKLTPMTKDHVALNAADAAQYNQLLQTGDVDDIKNFFKGRQGPQPSWQDVNTWVQHRDNATGPVQQELKPDFNYEDQYNKMAEDQHNEANRQALEDHVTAHTSKWTNAPDIEVVHGPEDIADPEMRSNAVANDGNGNALGFFGSDGKVRMYSGRITSPEMANAVLYHEALGHSGLADVFGDKLDSTMLTMAERNVSGFGKLVDSWQEENPNAYGGDRARAAEEVLAELSEKGQIKPAWQDAMTSAVRQFGRKMRLKLGYSDGEVRNIMAMAHDAVLNGQGRDVPANGFRGVQPDPTSKFMYSGQKNALGEPQTDPSLLDHADQLKQDPRYWSDPEFRSNVNELARTRFPADTSPKEVPAAPKYASEAEARAAMGEKFMRKDRYEKSLTRDDEYTNALEETVNAYTKYESQPVSFEETKRAAMNLGFTPSQIRDLGDLKDLNVKIARIGGALNAAKARIMELNEKLDTPSWSMADKEHHIQAVMDYNYMMDKYLGNGTEMGRGLQTIKQLGFTRGVLGNLNDLLREHGGSYSSLADDETFQKFARALKLQLTEGNDAAARVVMRSVTKPYWEQYLTTLWHNSMLSSLATHFKSTVDMINGIGLDAQERMLSMPIGYIRSMFGGEAGRTPQEAFAYTQGVLRSVANMEMYKAALHAAGSGEGSFVTPNGARTMTNTNTFGTLQNPRIPDKFGGAILNKPIDLISAQDTLMRSVAVSGHIYDQAMQMATQELSKGGAKPSGKDIQTRAEELAHNPTITMIKTAMDKADHTLLMNANPLNTLVDKGRIYRPGMTLNDRVGTFLLNTITPFIRVESNNLWSRLVMRSPLGLLDRGTRVDLASGGKAADLALARMAYGTVKMGMFWAAAGAGSKLMGHGPDNQDKFKELQASGWSPDSVRENGHFTASSGLNTSLNPFDMHNNTASMVASAREAFDKGADKHQWGIAAKLALGSIFHDLASQSWVNDLAPAIEAATTTGGTAAQKFTQVATTEATNFLPNGLTQVAHLMDPNRHDVSATDALGNPDISGTIKNTIESRLPGMTNNLPIKYSVYGDPIQNGASLTGVRTPLSFVGINGNNTKEVTDPAEKELARLGSLAPAAVITPVQRSVKIDDPDGNGKIAIKLNENEFQDYQRLAGKSIVYNVQQAMNDPSWQTMSDKDKILEVRDIQTDMKKQAREALQDQWRGTRVGQQ